MSQALPGPGATGHPAIACLLLTKALDATTTAVGLTLVPGLVESNPFAAVLFSSVGVLPGLLLATLAVLAVVVGVTEAGVAWLRKRPDTPGWGPTVTRIVGYLPPSLVFGVAAVHNTTLLWSAW